MNYLILGATALTLGLRHGVDIDHIAAILDIAGTSASGTGTKPLRKCHDLNGMRLPVFYVLGHGLMVLVLGLAALYLGAVIPKWLDGLMERAVGLTLLILSAYLFYSLVKFWRGGEELTLRSRWMLVFDAVGIAWSFLSNAFRRKVKGKPKIKRSWGDRSAFAIGLIHGFGAETGTQVLLFATVAGVGSLGGGLYMLFSFTLGMIFSTLAIAVCLLFGFARSRFFKPALVALGVISALLSLVVGLYFAFGKSDALPSF